jgi:hypothetical protein
LDSALLPALGDVTHASSRVTSIENLPEQKGDNLLRGVDGNLLTIA